VLSKSSGAGCLVVCGPKAPARRRAALEKAGAQVLALPSGPADRVDLTALLAELGRRGVISLLLEGGARLAWGFLSQGLIDEIVYFYAPKLIGGAEAPGMIGGAGFAKMAQAVMLEKPKLRRLGDDIMMQARIIKT